jgi:alpha-1,2-mannosyltransferase
MSLRSLTPRERWLVIGFGALYAAAAIPIGIHRGGDFVQELQQTERLIAGLPIYGHNPDKGVYWPPLALFALVPFALLARLSLALAQAAWAIVNVWCLGWSVSAAGRRWGWRPALLGVACIAKPLQGNIEHQNITIVLLALIMAALFSLEEGRSRRSGVWIGIATGLKAFPGLLLPYLLLRRHWRAAAIGAAAAAGLTFAAMLRYGPVGAVTTSWSWFTVSRTAPIMQQFGTQPLGNMLFTGLGVPTAAVIVVEVLLALLVFAAVMRWPPGADVAGDVGLIIILAVLVTPIGWFYYHTLAYPAWMAALTWPAPVRRRWLWTSVLVLAGVLLSGVMTFDHFYPEGLMLVKRFNYVWGALLLLGALITVRLTSRPAPTRAWT